MSLTHHEAHQLVGQHAGGDERHPQADVKLPGALRLHPHEQADTQKGEKDVKYRSNNVFLVLEERFPSTHFLIFSRTSAILPNRFWKHSENVLSISPDSLHYVTKLQISSNSWVESVTS